MFGDCGLLCTNSLLLFLMKHVTGSTQAFTMIIKSYMYVTCWFSSKYWIVRLSHVTLIRTFWHIKHDWKISKFVQLWFKGSCRILSISAIFQQTLRGHDTWGLERSSVLYVICFIAENYQEIKYSIIQKFNKNVCFFYI